jgi:hypothetical protein
VVQVSGADKTSQSAQNVTTESGWKDQELKEAIFYENY